MDSHHFTIAGRRHSVDFARTVPKPAPGELLAVIDRVCPERVIQAERERLRPLLERCLAQAEEGFLNRNEELAAALRSELGNPEK